MVRLTRAQQQARTRAAVLAAARQEFVEYGYGPAKVDRIAERAELTRGAVYSNFPSKRALYLAVLVDLVDTSVSAPAVARPATVADALGAFAVAWLERMPLTGDAVSGGRLQLRSLVGVVDDEPGRAVVAQLARLEALLLAVGLESCRRDGPTIRMVRLAELALTILGGSSLLAEVAPGFGDPFDQTTACEHLADLDLADTWSPPQLPYVRPAAPGRAAWAPGPASDLIGGGTVDLTADGIVVILGARRLGAAEEAVRSARADEVVTVVAVTDDPAETGRLVRLRIADLMSCLRRVFPLDTWRTLGFVLEEATQIAQAAGAAAPGDETEVALRIRDGVVVARAEGRGAALSLASDVSDGNRRGKRHDR